MTIADRNDRRRLVSELLCAVLLAVLLFSVGFAAHAEVHDCTGEDCPVCACIQLCERTLKQLAADASAGAGFAILLVPALSALLLVSAVLAAATPVTQKIRMNN